MSWLELDGAVNARDLGGLPLAGGAADDGEVPLLEGRSALDGVAAAYVCEGFVCKAPVTDPGALNAQLS